MNNGFCVMAQDNFNLAAFQDYFCLKPDFGMSEFV